MSENLPTRLTKMVVELHRRGYTSLYLYCGMSPSGMNWRFTIGTMIDGKWPAHPYITNGSVRAEGDVDWTKDSSTVAALADGFESYFSKEIRETKSASTEYSRWFDSIVSQLAEDEVLVFYADYEAEHEALLKDAPGYRRN